MKAGALLLLGLLLGCSSSRNVDTASGRVAPLGSFRVESDQSEGRTLTPSSCSAGDRQMFLGADFTDETSASTIRLVVDPIHGPAVRIFNTATPFEGSITFQRTECETFHFSLDSSGWRINDVRDYAVSLELSCTRGHDIIRGNAKAKHCH